MLAEARSRSASLFEPIKHTAEVWEVDPTSNRLVGKPLLLNGPVAAAVSGTSVWVAGRNYGTGKTTLLRIAPVMGSNR